MRALHRPYTGVVVLRPWPFGGRALHHDAGMAGTPLRSGSRPTSRPVGLGPRWVPGLLVIPLLCVMKTSSINNQKVSNGNQDVTRAAYFRIRGAPVNLPALLNDSTVCAPVRVMFDDEREAPVYCRRINSM